MLPSIVAVSVEPSKVRLFSTHLRGHAEALSGTMAGSHQGARPGVGAGATHLP